MLILTENVYPSDYDIAYGYGEWSEPDGLNATLLKKSWFRDRFSRSQTLEETKIGTWLEFKNGVDGSWKNCNGTLRNLYVTISKIN